MKAIKADIIRNPTHKKVEKIVGLLPTLFRNFLHNINYFLARKLPRRVTCLFISKLYRWRAFSQTTGYLSRIEINYVSLLILSWRLVAGAIPINFESVRKLLPNRGRILLANAKPTQTFSLGGNHFQCFLHDLLQKRLPKFSVTQFSILSAHTQIRTTMIFGTFWECWGSFYHSPTVVRIQSPYTASVVLFVNILIGEWVGTSVVGMIPQRALTRLPCNL